jgi:hypothetical protein
LTSPRAVATVEIDPLGDADLVGDVTKHLARQLGGRLRSHLDLEVNVEQADPPLGEAEIRPEARPLPHQDPGLGQDLNAAREPVVLTLAVDHPRPLVDRQPPDVLTAEADLTGARAVAGATHQGIGQTRFARPIRREQGMLLTLRHGEIDPVENTPAAQAEAEAGQLEQCDRGRHGAYRSITVPRRQRQNRS